MTINTDSLYFYKFLQRQHVYALYNEVLTVILRYCDDVGTFIDFYNLGM